MRSTTSACTAPTRTLFTWCRSRKSVRTLRRTCASSQPRITRRRACAGRWTTRSGPSWSGAGAKLCVCGAGPASSTRDLSSGAHEGLWRSLAARSCMACRRSGVRIPLAPPGQRPIRIPAKWVHANFVGDQDRLAGSAGQAAGVWLRAGFQIWSSGLLACWQRSVVIALAPATVQCMPDCLRRWPTTALQPDPRLRSRRTGRGSGTSGSACAVRWSPSSPGWWRVCF